jgi:hypothetical protein
MSGAGQTRHFDRAPITSGLPLLADNFRAGQHVSKVPNAEVFSLAWEQLVADPDLGFFELSPKLQAAARWIAGLRAEPVIGRRYAPTRWRIPE